MIPTLTDHLLVLVLGLVLPFFSGIRGSEQMRHVYFDERTRRRFFISNSLVLWLLALVVMGVWYWNERPWPLMGFRLVRNQWSTWISSAVLIGFFLFEMYRSYASESSLRKTFDQWESNVPFLPEHARELPAYIVLCISAAVCEEIMYRGFMVTYFINPMKDGFPWIAVFFPAVLFSLAHFYQGYEAMGKIFLLSILFSLVFIFSGSLIIVIIVHFFIDLIGGIVALRFKRNGVH